MLGVSRSHYEGVADRILADVAKEIERGHTTGNISIAAFQDYQEAAAGGSADPYFLGHGPSRKPCNLCAGCMVGCRFDAKNTLDRNYLHFAERNGVEVRTETEVEAIEPLPGPHGERDGSGGYELCLRTTTGWRPSCGKVRTMIEPVRFSKRLGRDVLQRQRGTPDGPGPVASSGQAVAELPAPSTRRFGS
jgi:cholesterol oxidase